MKKTGFWTQTTVPNIGTRKSCSTKVNRASVKQQTRRSYYQNVEATLHVRSLSSPSFDSISSSLPSSLSSHPPRIQSPSFNPPASSCFSI